MAINRKENFGVEGFRCQRNNPDGTIPTASNMYGFAGTIDVDALAGTETISLKIDAAAAITATIDITGGTYVDDTVATIDEVVTAINAAITAEGSLTALTFSSASDALGSTRIKCVCSSGTKVQLYGTLIAYLGFGEPDGKPAATTGIGLKIVKGFDTTKSISLPKNIKDKEEIENESSDGSLTSVISPALVKGITPVITCAKNDLELKQLISGGVYSASADTYEPPTISEQDYTPKFYVEVFTPEYDEGSNLRSNIAAWERITLRSCAGYEGDITKETKTWSDLIFNLDATEAIDTSGDKIAAWTEEILTVAEYEALNVSNV